MERKPTKPRAVNFSLIPPADNGHTPEPYRILEKIREREFRLCELYEERAAIKQYLGNMSREQAEREAFQEVYGEKK